MMTIVEAVEVLKANYPDACFEQLREAVDAAIVVLKAQDTAGDTVVSRQAVRDWLSRWEGYVDKDTIIRMQARVIDIPSADVEPVKHGKWIVEHGVLYGHGEDAHYGDLWHCSECGRRELDVEGWDYCPTCGAKMEGTKEK